jgi:hypothetical protein
LDAPRKHHYVPVFYQKHFANADGLLWVYDRKLYTYKELHPNNICCEKDLYSITPEGKPKDQRLESIGLSQADGFCATAIREITADLSTLPARKTIEVIAQFVGLQYSRVPAMRGFVSTMWENSTKETMRLIAVNEGRMQSVIDRYVEKTGDTIDVSAKAMVEVIREDRLKVVVTEVPFLVYVWKTGEMVSHTVMQTSWQVLIAPPDAGFILCDHPVVVVPRKGSAQIGFFVAETVTYVPLTRRVCLRLSGKQRTFQHRGVDRRTVRIINHNIAASSERFIMGPIKEQLEAVVDRSGSANIDATPRFTFETTAQSDNDSSYILSVNPRRYFYLNNAVIAP